MAPKAVALRHGGFNEAPQRVVAGGRLALGGQSVGQHLLERTVGKKCQQLLAGGEVPVKRSDADTGIGGDGRHRHSRTFPEYSCDGGPNEGLVVVGGVTALPAGVRSRRAVHASIERCCRFRSAGYSLRRTKLSE